ncbi:hypothetical protein SISSUDRAFT_1097785 [Sistotremastrum suecicum HHB10207 ss-3]|uniref:Uncharacterized protein n=1 Tax=Sistotremastrum suecicum HHB10207 ss-3 TaxID=1314776 RepID=A0A165X8I9_9AGAM|nr:hypothetical protein SISSUDRAFT_1097785 [Sistotremastrum suecicum HHB10207 ss-3]
MSSESGISTRSSNNLQELGDLKSPGLPYAPPEDRYSFTEIPEIDPPKDFSVKFLITQDLKKFKDVPLMADRHKLALSLYRTHFPSSRTRTAFQRKWNKTFQNVFQLLDTIGYSSPVMKAKSSNHDIYHQLPLVEYQELRIALAGLAKRAILSVASKGASLPEIPSWGSNEHNHMCTWKSNEYEILAVGFRDEVTSFLGFLASYHDFDSDHPTDPPDNPFSDESLPHSQIRPILDKGKQVIRQTFIEEGVNPETSQEDDSSSFIPSSSVEPPSTPAHSVGSSHSNTTISPESLGNYHSPSSNILASGSETLESGTDDFLEQKEEEHRRHMQNLILAPAQADENISVAPQQIANSSLWGEFVGETPANKKTYMPNIAEFSLLQKTNLFQPTFPEDEEPAAQPTEETITPRNAVPPQPARRQSPQRNEQQTAGAPGGPPDQPPDDDPDDNQNPNPNPPHRRRPPVPPRRPNAGNGPPNGPPNGPGRPARNLPHGGPPIRGDGGGDPPPPDPPNPAGAVAANPPPNRPVQLHLDLKLKPDIIPKWDGNTDKIARWILEINDICKRSRAIYNSIGQFIPFRLEGSAKTWYMSYPVNYRTAICQNWDTFRFAVVSYYITRQWHHEQTFKADSMWFRQPGHSLETPAQYYERKTEIYRLLGMDLDTQIIYRVMKTAPDWWETHLQTHRINNLVDFQRMLSIQKEALIKNRDGPTNYLPGGLHHSSNSVFRRPVAQITNGPPRRFKSRAQAVLQSPPKPSYSANQSRGNTPVKIGRRPCRHCGKDHWDNECPNPKKANVKLALSELTPQELREEADYMEAYQNYIEEANPDEDEAENLEEDMLASDEQEEQDDLGF